MKKKLKKVIVNKQVFSLKQTQALTSAKSPEANQVSDEIVDIRGRIGSSITKRVEPSGNNEDFDGMEGFYKPDSSAKVQKLALD